MRSKLCIGATLAVHELFSPVSRLVERGAENSIDLLPTLWENRRLSLGAPTHASLATWT
jgi:hypothetical protein